jgi:long-chain acyl-CoA synthetase
MIDPALPRFPSIVHALRSSVERHPQQPALICRERTLSYAALGDAVLGVARSLERLDVGRRRVVVALPTSIEAVVAVFGALAAGARVVPLNPFFTRSELEPILRDLDARVAICGDDARDKLRELAPGHHLQLATFAAEPGRAPTLELGAGPRQQPLGREPGSARWEALPELEPGDVAIEIFTGGTTGEPKAVEHTHASACVSVLQHCTVWPVRAGAERFLSAAPIFHIWGLFYSTFVPLYAGGTLVLVPRYDAEEILAAIEAQRITVFGGGPAPAYLGLMRSPRMGSTDFSSLRYCLSGGSPCPLDLHQRWRRATGCALLEGWGMSEAAPLCLSRPEAPKPQSVGRPVPETEVEVVDLEQGTRRLGSGEAGEVRVRGPQLMAGYRGKPDATRDMLRGGWLYTGDIGYLDADGDLFLVDRKKDMIITGGYNVYPRLVDEVLYGHPAIAEAATVGRADERLGEVLVAFVVLEQGAALDEAGFFEYCRQELVKYRRPVAVTFLPALPRTNTRKVDKKALRALAERAANGSGEPR